MSNNVSSVVWPWREKSATGAKPEKNNPSAIKVIVQVAIMVCIGLLLYAWLKHAVMAFAVWGLAGVVLVAGFFIPPVFAAIERFGKWLGKWVGEILTWALLTPFYFLCFLPMRISMKIRRKDPLQRQFDAAATTYWTPRKPIPNVAQYRKQF